MTNQLKKPPVRWASYLIETDPKKLLFPCFVISKERLSSKMKNSVELWAFSQRKVGVSQNKLLGPTMNVVFFDMISSFPPIFVILLVFGSGFRF